MAISDTQKVDLLFKKIGYGVAKTDVATSKSPANETVSSPLLLRGENLWTQSDSISNVGTLPSSNVLVSGSTTVAIYRDSLSSSVQTTNDATAGTNRTWKTGLTNWIGPEFGSGYAVKVYTGASLTAATASSGTSLPVDGSGNNDSWYFDYQSGVLNFADTNVPSSIAAQVWVVGARYTGAVGIATLPALTVTGNISSTNGNVVLTNGSMYATNYYGTFQGTIGGGTSISQSNVASYAAITNLTNNQTYYLEFANVTAGNSVTGAVSTVNVNPSTSTISALAFAGGSGAFTTLSAAGVTQITNGTNATSTATGALQVSGGAGIAGNLYVGGITVISGNVTIGGNLTVSGNSLSIGASTLSITDPIINLNTPTDLTPLTSPTTSDIGIKMHYYDTVDSAAFLGRATDTGYLEWYSRGTDTANVFVGTVYGTIKPGALVLANAKVLGGGLTANTGALQVWGDGSVNGNLYVGGIFTTGSINATPIGNATASTGNFTTLNATSGLTASTVQAATIGNAGANAQLGFITATTLNAATIGNASAAHVGSTVTLTGLVTAATVNAATIGNASAVLAGATATLTGLVTAATVNAATIGNTGAALTGATLSTSSTITASGNIVAQSGTASTTTTTGALVVNGGAGITGALNIGGNETISGNLAVDGGQVTLYDSIIDLHTYGNLAAWATDDGKDIGVRMHYYNGADKLAFFGLENSSKTLQFIIDATEVAGNVTGTYGNLQTGSVVVSNTTAATGTTIGTAGALYVAGGAGIAGALYAGSIQNTPIGSTTASTGNFTTLNATTSLTTATVNAATIGNASAAHVGSTVTLTGLVTAATVNAATIGNASAVLAGATATLTGLVTAATVNAATIGNTGAALTGATLSTSSTITASGNIVAQSGTASTTTTTGALVVNGGAGITGALNIGGNETISGNLAVDGGQVTLYDSIIDLHTYGNLAAWATDDGKDIGVRMHYYNGADKLAFFGLENSSKTLQFIIDATEVAGNVTGTYGNLQTGSVVVSNTTAATGTTIGTAGALYVAGGAGIAGALYAGSIQNTPIGSTTASTGNFTTLNATTSLTTATVNAATIGNASASHVGSTVTITGLVTAATVNAATIGNASAVLAGATATLTGLVTAATVNAATIGNTGATFSGSTGTFVGNISAGNLTTSGSNGNISGVNTVFATLFSGSGASLTNLPASQVAGTVTTANVSMYDNFTNTSTNATFYPSFFDKLTGNGSQFTSSTLSYNPSTGALTATSFNGVGTFSTATTSSTFISGGNVVITSGVDAVSPTTGALLLTGSGGASVGGNLYVAKDLYVGAGAFNTTLTTPTIFAVDQGSSYAQGAILNSSNTGSADWIAYGNNYPGASNDHGWVDIGFTGDAFSDPNYSITKRNDAYLFGSGANATVGGNLVLSTDYTGSFNDIVLGVGSFYANSEVARFHGNTSNSGTFIIKLPTNASPAANTGALQVWGGASFSSNVYHGGGTILNGSKTAGFDTIVKGNRDDTLIWARPNATYDAVILGNSATAATVVNGAKLQINTSDSILLPVGTNAQRPSASGLGTDTAGMLRYSTTAGSIEWYNGSAWTGASSSFTVIADEQFNGTGSQTIFTLSTSQTTNSCIVSINGVVQIPTLAYAVTSGTTLTFTEAPASGDVIDVRKLTTTQTVTGITSTNGYMQFAVDNYGAYVYTGTASTAATTFWSNTGAEVNAVGNVTTSSIGDATLDSFFANTYSSAEYTVTATLSGTTVREMAKILIVHNGTTASRVVYGVVSTAGNALVSYSANIVNGSATLYGTPTNANTVLRIRKNYQAI